MLAGTAVLGVNVIVTAAAAENTRSAGAIFIMICDKVVEDDFMAEVPEATVLCKKTLLVSTDVEI